MYVTEGDDEDRNQKDEDKYGNVVSFHYRVQRVPVRSAGDFTVFYDISSPAKQREHGPHQAVHDADEHGHSSFRYGNLGGKRLLENHVITIQGHGRQHCHASNTDHGGHETIAFTPEIAKHPVSSIARGYQKREAEREHCEVTYDTTNNERVCWRL